MKKIFTILCLMALTMGAQAGVVTNRASAGSPMTYNDFLALAGTGKHFAIVPSSNNTAVYPLWFGFTATKVSTLTTEYLFEIEQGTMWNSHQAYGIKRVSDGKWVKLNGTFDADRANMQNFKPNNRRAGDYAPEYSDVNLHISLDQPINPSNHYNANGLGWNSGSGGYSTYVAFGPFNTDVTIKYLNSANNEELQATENGIMLSGTVEAPEIAGYTIQGSSSATIDTDGQVITFLYDEAASFDYTLVVNGEPEGTTITIKGEPVSAGAHSFDEAVSESDVVVTLPSGQSDFYSYTVTISGTTITVNFTALWPVSFGEGTVIRVGEKVSSVTAATSPADNDHWYIITQVRDGESVTFARGENEKLRRGTTAQTAASFNKTDATANGAYLVRFISTGENDLYKMQFGNAKFVDNGLKPSSTSITNAATYAFYNSNGGNGSYFGWNIDSKAGQKVDNNGAGNDVAFWGNGEVSGTSGNNIWYVYETTIDVPAYFITYVVNDENGDELFRSEKIVADEGQVITELPTEYQRAAFYTYNTVNVTINGDNEAVFTATLKENAPVQFTKDATNPIYYNAKIRGKYLMYDSSVTDELKLQDTSEPFYHYAAWAFVGDPYKGFNVINQAKGANSVLTYTSVTTSKPANHNIQFQTGAEAEAKTWLIETNNNSTYPGGIVLRMKESTNIYFHHEKDGNYLRTCSKEEWGSVHNDEGSTIIITTDKDALVELYNLLNAMELGTGLNQYSKPSDYDNVMAAANTVIANEQVADYETQYNALKALQASLTLNMPQANTFLRIKSVAQNGYVSSRTGVEVKPSLNGGTYANYYTTTGSATADSTIWFYDGTHLLNYKTGLYTNNCSAADLGSEGVTFAFSEAPGVLGNYNIKPAGSNYWYGGDPTLDNHSDNANANTRFTLEYVNELPITLRRASDDTPYFATFSAPVNVRISGASLNTVTNNNKTAAYNTVDTDMLKAGVGVLLSGTSPTATATIITDEVDEADYGLVKYYAATAGTGDESKLYLGKGKTSGKAGFYKLGVGTTSNGFKAYLNNTTELGGAKEGLELEFAGVTGIENMEHGTLNMNNGAIYNLQGQRVNKAQKGVYIINNKKVVVK